MSEGGFSWVTKGVSMYSLSNVEFTHHLPLAIATARFNPLVNGYKDFCFSRFELKNFLSIIKIQV